MSDTSIDNAADTPMTALSKAETDALVDPAAGRRPRLADLVGNLGVVAVAIAMIVAFSIALPTFRSFDNVKGLLDDQAIAGILALAVLVPLIAGEFDLSVGATLGIGSIVTAYASSHGVPSLVVLVIVLALGVLIGLINAGFILAGASAFIVTLGMATILAGANLLITGGNTIYQGISYSLQDAAQTELAGFSLLPYYFLILAFVMWFLIEHATFGRYVRATGLGRDAARLSGVRTNRWLIVAFVMAGAIAALAGLLQTARTSAAPPTIGPDYLLPAYAAAFLGATTIKRGLFNVWGTVVGVFLLAIGINGLTLAGAPFWVPQVFSGGALILAVTVAALVGRRGK
jgi:ribose transport system permease protein